MTIVVGYVPTPEGEAALTQAIAEAKKSNNHLLVINSSKGDALVDNRYAQEPDIQGIEQRLATQGISHTITQPVRGHDAAAEVLDAADEHDADLIVIGLRRRSPVGKLIMGSVSQRILLEADCPVLAVKAD
ncbi:MULTISPECIES: universal stress protein [Paenarthrobacter]|uniref:Universal stress protein n=1 Tax=Paenarthrobacter ureafaciens TaxID=37931 RepID=A0AAX3EJG8_PAEUR|nr:MULTISPECIES: universal stress protein [Paenarthrobacter]AMB39306.1 universal stress protein UspA [Arthrobacter sp. ATCC 21022]NKR11424.1 universal stress protein UspA [Arthrobacter sp. M5]NKR17132.1 universal stress protein UspA [Arthrobacter sp. M6]OEH58603.1 universal stress protein UspA [Arthrobacter sp. D4]OEH64891.1 universal stress protein UspA [Arthrobacter sp. D2]